MNNLTKIYLTLILIMIHLGAVYPAIMSYPYNSFPGTEIISTYIWPAGVPSELFAAGPVSFNGHDKSATEESLSAAISIEMAATNVILICPLKKYTFDSGYVKFFISDMFPRI